MTTHFDNELCFRSRFFRAMQGSVLCDPSGFLDAARNGHTASAGVADLEL